MIKSKNIVIIGATSEIAQGVAKLYAQAGCRFFLVGRDEAKSVEIAASLKTFGALHTTVFITDLRYKDDHDTIIRTAEKEFGRVDVVLLAHGIYPDMKLAERDVDVMLDVIMTNSVSTLSIMHRFGLYMQEHEGGVIAVLSSVAGDRGRRNNYIYGSSKAILTAYASGMRASYADRHVHVLTVKPGPVQTSMTHHRNMPLTAKVDAVSKSIVNAIENKKSMIYTPWYWRFIMLGLRMLPEKIFMKVKF